LTVILGLLFLATAVFAQDNTLRPGVAVTGTLDAASGAARVYRFTGTAGQVVDLALAGRAGLRAALLVTDSSGATVAQAAAAADGQARLSQVALPRNDTYFVTVFIAPGSDATARGEFELTLATTAAAPEATAETTVVPTPEATANIEAFQPPGSLLTATGLQVKLTWNTVANLDLEVRDPVGGALFFRTPTVLSGGRLSGNVNSVCDRRTDQSPTEEGTWPAGAVPTGSYEVLVYYQPLTDCPTAEPVTLNLQITVDGRTVEPFQATLQPRQVFISSFVVRADGGVSKGLSGVDVNVILPAPAKDLQANAAPLASGAVTSSFITSDRPYRAYSFTGQANQAISVRMDAKSGSLDPYLVLLDPNGNIIDTNDDANLDSRNALINNRVLILPGQYTIVATRYGENVGGTEGDFEIELTGASVGASDLVSLGLPAGSVQVTLQWNTGADMRLLVREPQGDTIYDDIPQVLSGGRLISQGNLACRVSNPSPLSYIFWPEGRLPSPGPYEIEVRYQNQCNDARPVVFALNIIANGTSVQSITQQPLAGERYVTSFTINVDGQVTAGEGGSFGTIQRPDARSLDYKAQEASARVVASGETVTSGIRLNKRFDVYAFEGRANQIVTIGMEAINGTLDPALFLMDSKGNQVAQNDDANSETTNSLIREFTLPEDGRYIIIATHFGARYGVTAGDYRLNLRLN
jgi:hypothetical protein